jgi:hypothetical protein
MSHKKNCPCFFNHIQLGNIPFFENGFHTNVGLLFIFNELMTLIIIKQIKNHVEQLSKITLLHMFM